ncbi:DUF2062 domain-containing protein [Verrucomicrobia bacterium S94]|nr:DUF2062 domain-containing protein [Verrucomicrobia bacterium S94]
MVVSFKLIRKIGKMLRGGAGKREIFLGAFLGVLIGFNPTFSLTLLLAVLITLLLNANVGFALLGVAVGKILGFSLSVITFHTGFFMIHSMGLEGLFTKLANTPVLALMDLNVYSMIGSLPFALITGIVFGKFMAATVTKIREQMVKAAEHEKVGKAVGNKFSRFLMWLAFGKQKVAMSDVLAKESPLFRKSGIILVAVVLVVSLLMDLLFANMLVKKAIRTAIVKQTGAQVDIEKAHFSLGSGKVGIENLQVTDPEKPTHNLVQIHQMVADLSVSDLLRRTYTVDLLAGSILKFDVERESPGRVFDIPGDQPTEEEEPREEEQVDGKTLDDYLAQAEKWKGYGEKVYEYLKKAGELYSGETEKKAAKADKRAAVDEARKIGYLKAAADLVTDHPKLTIRKIEIDQVELGPGYPLQKLEGTEVSSHPGLNAKPTMLRLVPEDGSEPMAEVTLHFEAPNLMHTLMAHVKNIDIADVVKTGDKLNIEEGKADLSLNGEFSAANLDLPFSLTVHDLKTDNDILNSLGKLEIPGKLYGSLLLPRVKVEFDENLKEAAVDAAKEKAKAEVKKEAEKQLNKALESDGAKEFKDKLKGIF